MKHIYLLAFMLFNVTFSQISLDTSFNTTGLFNDNAPASQGPFVIKDVVELPSKAIILVGEKRLTNSIFGQNDLMVVKLKANGTVDTSFATNGVYRLNYQNDYDQANAVALQADGKILVAGDISSGGAFHGAIIRLNADGSLDTTFGSGGIKLHHLSSAQDKINDILVTDSGIYLGYLKGVNGTVVNRASVCKILANGNLDTSFGVNGVLDFNYTSGASDEELKLLQDASNRLVAQYYSSFSGGSKVKVIRFSTAGSIDTSFGTGGVYEYQQNDSSCNMRVIGNTLVLSGRNSGAGIVLRKLKENGQLDTSFGTSGVVTFDKNNSRAEDVVIHDDGKITVAGSSAGNKATLYRFQSNGAIDTSFGTNGVLTFAHSGIRVFRFNNEKSKYLGISFTIDSSNMASPKPLSWIGRYTDMTLSISDESYDNDVVIFPNPMKERLYIKTKAVVKYIKLYDTLGKTMLVSMNSKAINTSGLSAGLYVLEVVFKNGQTVVKKVVK